jgi:hypothetical protein
VLDEVAGADHCLPQDAVALLGRRVLALEAAIARTAQPEEDTLALDRALLLADQCFCRKDHAGQLGDLAQLDH